MAAESFAEGGASSCSRAASQRSGGGLGFITSLFCHCLWPPWRASRGRQHRPASHGENKGACLGRILIHSLKKKETPCSWGCRVPLTWNLSSPLGSLGLVGYLSPCRYSRRMPSETTGWFEVIFCNSMLHCL